MSEFSNGVSHMQASCGAAGGVILTVALVLAAAVFAYLCGCFNGSIIVSKYILRDDIRQHGSGNAGLTNFYRVFGGPWTVLVFVLDVLKAVAAVLVGGLIAGSLIGGGNSALMTEGRYFAGLFCILGHMFPCFFGFRGGKGIMSGGVIAIFCDWRVALIVWGIFLVLTVITRWVSLGSCAGALAWPVATIFFTWDWVCIVCSAVCGILIIWKHRENLQRIVRGEESRFSLHRKQKKE